MIYDGEMSSLRSSDVNTCMMNLIGSIHSTRRETKFKGRQTLVSFLEFTFDACLQTGSGSGHCLNHLVRAVSVQMYKLSAAAQITFLDGIKLAILCSF